MKEYRIYFGNGFLETIEGDEIQIAETTGQVLIYNNKKIVAIAPNSANVVIRDCPEKINAK